ncbi:hypothetical protein GCM10022267_09900 [Lentzea roselyniae]|uniref:HTH deoR-type domain-containing protein n=1 Tax=Lentzea roselyniae TaxID=531940 RepID=A0ABP7A655_9PSEU
MPIASSTATSGRLLALLSMLQVRRDWPGGLLAERLGVSERTVRRDVDRLRELGYVVHAVKGPDGGYRLEAGSEVPPLLFDEEQAIALAVALRIAVGSGAGIEESAARALVTVRQVLPARLRRRVDALEITAVGSTGPQVDTDVVLALSGAVRAREEVRFDYRSPGRPDDTGPRPPRRVQPHHLVVRAGRWYLVGWSPEHEDWRTYRADRMTPRTPNGPRFTPREVPGGDVAADRVLGRGALPQSEHPVADLDTADALTDLVDDPCRVAADGRRERGRDEAAPPRSAVRHNQVRTRASPAATAIGAVRAPVTQRDHRCDRDLVTSRAAGWINQPWPASAAPRTLARKAV